MNVLFTDDTHTTLKESIRQAEIDLVRRH
ncbi:hypothetical protein [Paenilisteria rocourtiae]